MKLLIFDLDGVIYRGGEPMPNAVESVAGLRRRGFAARFLTNNSTRSRAYYSRKLAAMGIDAREEDIMSSSSATCRYLRERSPGGARVFVVGEQGIHDELGGFFSIVGAEDRETADYVVVGYDGEFNFEKLTHAFDALLAGAELIATNRDPTYPMPNGRLLPGGGAIVAALAAAIEREPYVCGKPNPLGIRILMDDAGAAPEETLLIGDRPSSDMVTGRAAGVRTCLVLTGVTAPEEVDSIPENMKPDYVINDLSGLASLDCLKTAAAAHSDGNYEARKAY